MELTGRRSGAGQGLSSIVRVNETHSQVAVGYQPDIEIICRRRALPDQTHPIPFRAGILVPELDSKRVGQFQGGAAGDLHVLAVCGKAESLSDLPGGEGSAVYESAVIPADGVGGVTFRPPPGNQARRRSRARQRKQSIGAQRAAPSIGHDYGVIADIGGLSTGDRVTARGGSGNGCAVEGPLIAEGGRPGGAHAEGRVRPLVDRLVLRLSGDGRRGGPKFPRAPIVIDGQNLA